jgi:MFS family permease
VLREVRPILALIAGIGLVVTANGLLGTAVALRLEIEGAGPGVTGAVLAAFFAGVTAGARYGYLIVDRAGHIRAFAAFAGTACASTLLLPLLVHPPVWVLLRALTGFAAAGVFLVAESWLNARATPLTRAGLLAAYMTANQLGLGGGQLLVPVFPLTDTEPFALAAALFAAALIPVALTATPQPLPVRSEEFGFARLLRVAPLALIGCLISGLFVGAWLSTGPLYASSRLGGTGEVATFMLSLILGGLLLQWPIGRLSDRLGRRPTIELVGLALLATAGLAAWMEPSALRPLAGLGLALGALGFVVYPLSLALANDVVSDPSDRVGVSGTLLLAYGVGATLGPLLSTGAVEIFEDRGLPLVSGGAAVLLAGSAAWRLLVARPIPAAEREPFVGFAMPETAPALELDPRSESQESTDPG